MATATLALEEKQSSTTTAAPASSEFKPGVLAGVEVSDQPDVNLSDTEKNTIKELRRKAARRDYPARLIEVIQAWEAALFYRGFQFLIPLRGGGWSIPAESTGYGPSMQMDLALLPTNIYSAHAQILISSLTRSVPGVRFVAQDGSKDAQISAAQSADKFVKVVERNNDLLMIQTDASRYLFTDGRYIYWTRFVRDGQKFGWEEDDVPDDIVPENEPDEKQADQIVAGEEAQSVDGQAAAENPSSEEAANNAEPGASGSAMSDEEEEAELAQVLSERTPRGQEVRTAHGKLESKIVPMMANTLADAHAVQLEWEIDLSTAKGMFPKVAKDIKGTMYGDGDGEIAKLARQNVKLGMQATYVTSDSIAEDVTIQRTWFRPCVFMTVDNEDVRNSLIAKFPDGMLVCYANDTFCYARNESMDWSLSLGQAYSGDGQNRNALGTSLMPIQKRLNNWLDLTNDYFVRGIPKIWMDSKTFNLDAIRAQTNIPGDRGGFKRQGIPVDQLVWAEPRIEMPISLADFVKEYKGELAETLSGAYPALAGGQTDTDTFRGMALQRDQALGRLGPTWHSIRNAEANAMRQAVRWGAKCRKGTINERIPGGEVVRLVVNDLDANIMCYAESDENFPEAYPQKQQRLMGLMEDTAKNPQLQEVLFSAANLDFMMEMTALTELYIPQVASWRKQEGEFELLLKQEPVPNPKIAEAEKRLEQLKAMPNHDPQAALQIEMMISQLTQQEPLVTSVTIDGEVEDNDTEALCCWKWMMEPEGRKMKRTNLQYFMNVRLHFLAHQQAAADKAAKMAAQATAGKKPPGVSINYKDTAAPASPQQAAILQQAGIQPEPAPSPGAPGSLPGLAETPATAGAPLH